MFRYFLAFLLINTCYQSLGIPIQPSAPQQLSKSLATLAGQCKNAVLSQRLLDHVKECDLSVPPYSKKQFQCLIFYDINMQLCSASKLMISEDSFAKIEDTQDVNAVCALAKDWVFTNMSEFVQYKESAEKFFKLPATCGEVCGVEDTMNEANYFCKYYKMGLEILKSQVTSTVSNNANNVAAPAISEPEINDKEDIPVTGNSNPVKPQDKTMNDPLQQTAGSAVAKTPPQKLSEVNNDAVLKSQTVGQVAPKQTQSIDEADNPYNPDNPENADNTGEADVNVVKQEDPVVPAPESIIPHNDQVNKTNIVQSEKPVVANEDGVPGLLLNSDLKPMAVLENPKPKAGDADDYADSDGNDADDENEDPGLEIKPDQETNQQTLIRDKLVVPVPIAHESEVSQKEFFPNSISDGFSDEDNDHFFPFFMTSVVLMVLLYVLYHNKSKVSKVFFGLILEGRQSGRRRNSRGHSYRRLDTLEQAMSANTAAPPSKIIY